MHLPIKPFADEFVLGWCGRFRFLNHYPNIKTLVDDLRYKLVIKEGSDSTSSDVPKLFIFAKAAGMEASSFIANNSLIPFLRAFDVRSFSDNTKEDGSIRFIKYKGTSVLKKGAWFCPCCLNDDLCERGIPYWRRVHQLPAVDWCLKHKAKLVGVFSSTAFDYPPPVKFDEICGFPDQLNNFESEHPVIQRYIAIVDYILHRKNAIDFHLVTHTLETRAVELGLISSDGEDLSLESTIKNTIPNKWLDGFNKEKSNYNLMSIFHNTKNQRATELYLLLFSFLFDSMTKIQLGTR